MTDDYASRVRTALANKGMTMRGAARTLHVDPAYISRVLNGKQRPSEQLARAIDELLGMGGESATAPPPAPATGPHADIVYMRSAMAGFLTHDNRYGGDTVAPAAVQVWREGQARLDRGEVPAPVQREYLAAVSEVAEVAGWLLCDAGQHDAARAALIDSHRLAVHAGDRSMAWFALDMSAMVAIERGSYGETLRIARELADLRVPPRVMTLTRIRTARAMAGTGDRRALDEIKAGRVGLGDSVAPRDPAWTWWVDEREVTGHEGECYLALGDASAAIPRIRRALDLTMEIGTDRRLMLWYTGALLAAYAAAQAWRDCEDTMADLPALLDVVRSGWAQSRLRMTVRAIQRSAPAWLSDLAADMRLTE